MKLKITFFTLILFLLFVACDAEKEAIARRSLMMPKPSDLPRNSKFVAAKHTKRDHGMARKMKKYHKRNKKSSYAKR